MVTELYGFKYHKLYSNDNMPIWFGKNIKKCRQHKRGMIWWISGIKKKERKYDF